MLKNCLRVLVLAYAVLGPMAGFAEGFDDNRQSIALTKPERSWLLNEMRDQLTAIGAIVTGLSDGEPTVIRRIATARGIERTSDPTRPLTIGDKTPDAWKAFARNMYREFDGIAEGVERQETSQQVLARVGRLTKICVSCHAMFQLVHTP